MLVTALASFAMPVICKTDYQDKCKQSKKNANIKTMKWFPGWLCIQDPDLRISRYLFLRWGATDNSGRRDPPQSQWFSATLIPVRKCLFQDDCAMSKVKTRINVMCVFLSVILWKIQKNKMFVIKDCCLALITLMMAKMRQGHRCTHQ